MERLKMIYRTIINYALAAGIFLGATNLSANPHPEWKKKCDYTKLEQNAIQYRDRNIHPFERILIETEGRAMNKEEEIYIKDRLRMIYYSDNGPCIDPSTGETTYPMREPDHKLKLEQSLPSKERREIIAKRMCMADFVDAVIDTDGHPTGNQVKDYTACLKKAEPKVDAPNTFSLNRNEDSEKRLDFHTQRSQQNPLDKETCAYNEKNEKLCSCQPAEKPKAKPAPKAVKKKLTIEEICAQQKVDAQSKCAYDRDQNLTKTREELWEEATRTGNYDDFGRTAFLEEVNAQNKYSWCGIEARLGEFECVKSAKDKQSQQAQSKKEAAEEKVRTYDKCANNCSGKYHTREYAEIVQEEIQKDKRRGLRRLSGDIYFASDRIWQQESRSNEKKNKECLKKCGKNPHPEQEEKYRRIQGLGKIDTGIGFR